MFAAASQMPPMVEIYRSVWGRVASRGQLKLVVTITSVLPLPINISVDTGPSLPVSLQVPQAAASAVAAQSTSNSQQGSPQGFSAFGAATFRNCQILLKDGTRLHGHTGGTEEHGSSPGSLGQCKCRPAPKPPSAPSFRYQMYRVIMALTVLSFRYQMHRVIMALTVLFLPP